jgi:hypothetical protein
MPTAVPTASTPAATATPAPPPFNDVHPSDYFYIPVRYLAAHGVISGYDDGSFRPYNPATRAQIVKVVVLGFQKPIIPPRSGQYTFADVPPAAPFFTYIETAAADHIVGGYGCGGPGEPCDATHRPYFRPGANVTRGQLSKITVVAADWAPLTPPSDSFADVPPGHPSIPSSNRRPATVFSVAIVAAAPASRAMPSAGPISARQTTPRAARSPRLSTAPLRPARSRFLPRPGGYIQPITEPLALKASTQAGLQNGLRKIPSRAFWITQRLQMRLPQAAQAVICETGSNRPQPGQNARPARSPPTAQRGGPALFGAAWYACMS